jgi:hypothetical protein
MPTAPFMKAIRSLDFRQDHRVELNGIEPRQWPALLKLTDSAQITLPLGTRCHDYLPASVRGRIEGNLAANALRHRRIAAEYRLIANALQARSVDFVVLKGLAQAAPYYVCDPRYRPQYDIDLYCPPGTLESAREALTDAGFRSVERGDTHIDHLPPMIRNTSWKWRGDYYAVDLPLTVEIHFRFWDSNTERLPAPGVEHFWRRRTSRLIHDLEIPVLSLADGISYSALHLVRHLLRGSVRVYHVYELAHFLQQTQHDDNLWQEWSDNRVGMPSVLESVAFRLAADWFNCGTHPIVDREVEALSPGVRQWFELFSRSPLAPRRPNKDELFLHLSLLESKADRRSVVRRRLLPRTASRLFDPDPPVGKRSVRLTVDAAFRQALFVLTRATHHVRTTLTLGWSLCRWKTAKRKRGPVR